jgi:DNA polymerase-3 subunit epsilon
LKSRIIKSIVASLPNSPGVYLFYGADDVLLYVGKSKSIRTRVRTHFNTRDEHWLTNRIHHIEVRETSGELGALLLESRLIKELFPLYNVKAKQRRRIVIAQQSFNSQGYAIISLKAVDYIDPTNTKPIMGIFKHKTQAKEFLFTVAKQYRLCSKLLKLENSHGCCFAYHLGQCDGACIGEEDVEKYNARVDEAFDARRIKAWPFDGTITVKEESKTAGKETFIIDNWCLLGSYKTATEKEFHLPIKSSEGKKKDFYLHRFDYDSYKILYNYLTDKRNQSKIHKLQSEHQQP